MWLGILNTFRTKYYYNVIELSSQINAIKKNMKIAWSNKYLLQNKRQIYSRGSAFMVALIKDNWNSLIEDIILIKNLQYA